VGTEPEQFGKFKLISRLGRGGMAETWKAQLVASAGVTRPVVIKRVLAGYALIPRFVEMFVNEARVTASLSHGNIAQVLDFGEVGGEYFLAIEYVHGRTVRELMDTSARQGAWHLPVPLACFIGIELCKALHYAHTRTDAAGAPLGIVHRDVSPENVLVSFEGQVKVVDFGVALSRLEGRNETEPGLVKGKYRYFSPEQARGEKVDARSDVFAVGVMLYEMLCGRLPFMGTEQETLQALLQGRYPPPASLNPALADGLGDVLDHALALDRDRRLQTAAALQEELSTYLFKRSPAFNAKLLESYVHEVFAGDLKAEAVQPKRDPAHLHELSLWKPTSVGRRLATDGSVREPAPTVLTPRKRSPVLAIAVFTGVAASLVVAGAAASMLLPPSQASNEKKAVAPPHPTADRAASPAPTLPVPTEPPDEQGNRAVDVVKYDGKPILLDLDRNSVQYSVFMNGSLEGSPNNPWNAKVKPRALWPAIYAWADFVQPYEGRRHAGFLVTDPIVLPLVKRVGGFDLRPFGYQQHPDDPRGLEQMNRGLPVGEDGLPESDGFVAVSVIDEKSGGYVRVTDFPPKRDVVLRLDFVADPSTRVDVAVACRYEHTPESRYQLVAGDSVHVFSPAECALAAMGAGREKGKLDVWVGEYDPDAQFKIVAGTGQPAQRLSTYAREHLDANAPADALTALDMCLQREDDLPCHLMAAEAFSKLGDRRSTEWHLRRVLLKGAGSKEAAEATARLEALLGHR
jgi:serine/threonine-protein kinase